MEKMTVSSCSQVPASRVLALLAALPGDRCHSLMTLTKQFNDPNETATRGTEPALLTLSLPCFVSRALYCRGATGSLFWLIKWQKGAVVSCPSCCELLSGSHYTLALFSTSLFGPSWGSQRARSDLAQLFSCWGFRYGLGRAMLEWLFLGTWLCSMLCGLQFWLGVSVTASPASLHKNPVSSN